MNKVIDETSIRPTALSTRLGLKEKEGHWEEKSTKNERAVMQKWHMIRKCDRLTEGPTNRRTD